MSRFLKAAKVVLWSFIGIRKSSAHRADFAELSYVHIAVAALICLAIFIAALFAAVHFAISQ